MPNQTLEKNLLRGTMVLTITSFIVKILSAAYRVPYQNLVGDEGFYVYQQIYPIYGIGMTLALTGLPVYLSKLLASSEDDEEREWYINAFFIVVSLVSFVIFASLYLFSNGLAKIMGDTLLAPLIRTISLIFLLVPLLATYRGVYQGSLEMKPTAISQLIEQGSRVFVILLAGYLFTLLNWTVYEVGQLAMFGAFVGGLFGLGVLWLYRKKDSFNFSLKGIDGRKLWHFSKKLLTEGGTLCFFSAYLIIFQLVDAFMVKQFLVYGGLTDLSAKIAKGVFDRGQPLVQLGLVVAVSMTAAFLPPLTKHFMTGEHQEHRVLVHSYIKVTSVVSAAAAVGLALLLPYINVTLFSDNQQELTLSLFMLSIYFVSMIQTYQTIYQSQNRLRYQLLAAVSGLFTKVISTPLFTFYFKTVGASLSTLLGLFVCLMVLRWYLTKNRHQEHQPKGYVLKLVMNLILMIVVLLGYRLLLEQVNWQTYHRGLILLLTLLGVILGGTTYIIGIIKNHLFTEKDWQMLPFGDKLTKRLF